MTIGNRITTLRKKYQFSQEEIADKIGVSRQSVSKWETDACAPDAYNLIELARVLNTSVEYIVTGKSNSDIKNKQTPLEVKNLAFLGYMLVICGFIMALVGMFMHEIWCIIGAYIAITGIIFALVRKIKIYIVLFSIMAILIVVTVLLLTL